MRSSILVITLGLFSVNCAVDVAAEGEFDTPEPVATATQELLGGWASGPFSWAQGQSARVLAPKATNVCVLTRLSGKFEGDGEWAAVWHDGNQWFLGGASKQAGVSAEATCFPLSGFVGGPSKAVSTEAKWNGQPGTLPNAFMSWSRGISECSRRSTAAWSGDAATMLAGLKGKMAGGGEWAAIDQSPGAFGNSLLLSHSCATYLTTYGFSFFVGDSANRRLAKFVNAAGVRGDLNAVGEFSVGSNGVTAMAPAKSAMCYFTRIQGGFRGGGESVQIRAEFDTNNVERWVLRSKKGGASDQVTASARCYARDQRDGSYQSSQ